MDSRLQPSVCFLPFWEPYFSHASSRLRAVFPARRLNAHGGVTARIGWAEDAQIYFVVQLCSDRMLSRLRAAKARRARIVYIVCDRHFADDVSIAGVNPKWRFAQLAELADMFMVPTVRMHHIIREFDAMKPITVIPDWNDYPEFRDPTLVPSSLAVAWFGNPGKGNFSAAEPYLQWLVRNGFELNIISRKEALPNPDLYAPYVREWDYASFVGSLRQNSISIIAFAPDELQKSENRLVTSVMNGVPAIVSGASSSAEALCSNGLDYAVVNGVVDFDQAVKRLQIADHRQSYLEKMQAFFRKTYGDEALIDRYMGLIQGLIRY